jgi:phytoene desaturase
MSRAAVIGSGFGGLAAAVRLQALGFDVTLLEARDKPGGRAYVYEEDGFVFDAGPTVITAPDCLEEVFAAAGRRMADAVEMLPVHPFYRLSWVDGDRMDYDGAALGDEIRRRSPKDAAGYDRFLDYSRRTFDRGYQDLAAAPFLRFADMLRVAPDLMRLRADRSVYATVARFVRDEKVREALSFHSLLVGGNPFETSAIYTLIHHLERNWGVFFPRGGTGALVAALVRLFEDLGGELRLESPVREARVDGRGRHLLDGEPFDLVVSNADVHHTYAKLYRVEPMRRRLEKSRWSMSLFVLYFGARGTWRDLAHHTVLFGPRYRALLREIFHGHALPADYSLYLHAPTVTDPSLAPAGDSAFYVLSPVPNLGQADLDWDRIAPEYAQRILDSLEQRLLPGLNQRLAVKRWFTPLDFQRQLNAFKGAAFSLAPLLTQSAWFRPHNRDPHIPGLYLVGAGTHPGAGLPGVINSAKATVELIARDFAVRRVA